MANGWNPLIGIGFTALGVGYLWEAMTKQGTPTPIGTGIGRAPTLGLSADGLRPNLPYATLEGRRQLAALGARGIVAPKAGYGVFRDKAGREVLVVKDGVRTIKFYPAGSIDNRLRYIIDQIRRDSKDPKTISEATLINSGKCPTANGGLKWCVPSKANAVVGVREDTNQMRISMAEVENLFWAIVNPNSPFAIRYTRDPINYDAFRSSDLMRRIPAGDCDDMTIRLGAWLMASGFIVKCRIVAPKGYPGQWAHIYLMVAVPAGEKRRWIPLDPTEPQNGFGWEVSDAAISSKRDFEV